MNPILDSDFPDPAVLARPVDGWWYAYATQHTTQERWARLQVARSRDLVAWELLGEALPERPAWSRETWELGWAPHVVERDGRYVMFYSAMPDDRSGMCLGVATADTPAGPFRDTGTPIIRGFGFEAIDPMCFRDPVSERDILFWGGDFAPIRAQPLTSDLMGTAPGSAAVDVLAPNPAVRYERLVEGPFVVWRDGRYVLFYSGDRFGGQRPRYAVSVARSESPFGPYERMATTLPGSTSAVLESSRAWAAPGHNCVITDLAGSDWIVYHAIDRADRWNRGVRFVRRKMLIDRLEWNDGWPSVANRRPSRRSALAPSAMPASAG